jgi:hypothetical protein
VNSCPTFQSGKAMLGQLLGNLIVEYFGGLVAFGYCGFIVYSHVYKGVSSHRYKMLSGEVRGNGFMTNANVVVLSVSHSS